MEDRQGDDLHNRPLHEKLKEEFVSFLIFHVLKFLRVLEAVNGISEENCTEMCLSAVLSTTKSLEGNR